MSKNKRYTIWTDEVLWHESARLAGLTYGVYDNEKEDKCTHEQQGGIITTREDALKRADEMNRKKI
jgi:hypothetical protein